MPGALVRPTKRRPRESAGDAALTVDQLARAAGTTTRQVRALQSRGVLPHPHLVGRTGYYDRDHLERLRAVQRLQDEGFSIASIEALLRAWEAGATLAQVLGLPSHARGGDDPDVFEGWQAPRTGRLLSVVPTTVFADPALAQPTAS